MNTPEDKPPPKSYQRAIFFGPEPKSDPKDETIASLEKTVQRVEDRLYEERFIWILVSVVLFDAYIFTHMANWAGVLVVGVIELFGIVVLADRCKVNTVLPVIDKLTGFANRAAGTAHKE